MTLTVTFILKISNLELVTAGGICVSQIHLLPLNSDGTLWLSTQDIRMQYTGKAQYNIIHDFNILTCEMPAWRNGYSICAYLDFAW